MRLRVAAVTGLMAGALTLTACGPAAIGGAGAIATPTTTSPSSPSSATTSPTSTSVTTSPTTTAATTPTTTDSPSSAPTTGASSATTPAAPTTTAAPAYLLTAGATGDQVRELQSRLKQLEWYDGDVSGTYDGTTTAGVRGFQSKRGTPETGSVDAATWATLTTMTRQPTDDEMHNRLTAGPALYKQGSTGAAVRNLQARL